MFVLCTNHFTSIIAIIQQLIMDCMNRDNTSESIANVMDIFLHEYVFNNTNNFSIKTCMNILTSRSFNHNYTIMVIKNRASTIAFTKTIVQTMPTIAIPIVCFQHHAPYHKQHKQISSHVAKLFLVALEGATITARAGVGSIAPDITKLGGDTQSEKTKNLRKLQFIINKK